MVKIIKTTFTAALVMAAFLLCIPQDGSTRNSRKRPSQTRNVVSEDDVRAEIQFGHEVGARILGQYALLENNGLTKYVNLIASALARNANRPELTFRVAVLKSDTINAYAAPGGYIFITKGAIDQMKDEAELAAVIAHEMAHITGRHIVKELDIKGTDSSASAGITKMVGGAGDPAKAAFASMVDKAMGILFDRGYKKEDEKDADASAVMYIALAGYDPSAMVSYFDRIARARNENMTVLNKTHPSFGERIDLINKTVKDEGLNELDYSRGEKRFNEIKKGI